MENAPIIPEAVEDDKDKQDSKSKKKSRKGYGLGSFAFELGKEEKDEKKEKSWFGFLEKQEDKKDQKEDKQEQADKKDKAEAASEPVNEAVADTESTSTETNSESLEANAPIEEISEIEASEIRPKIIEAIETVEKDAESDTQTDAPIEEFREIVKETGDADKAYEEVLSALDSNPEEVESLDADSDSENESEIVSDAVDHEDEPTEEPFGIEHDDELHEGEEVLLNQAGAEAEPETSEASIETSRDDSAEDSAYDTGTPGGSSGSTGSTPPSRPPAPPHGPFGPGLPPHGPNFNVNPAIASPGAHPDAAPKPQDPEYYYGASPAAMALFGGIIGYLIGRRRGRIKTERKLLPVQKKLEKQVEDLRFDIQEKEKAIRRIAAEKIKSEGPAIIERFKQTERERHEKPSRIKAPEATELHGTSKHHEHIGHMIVTNEMPRSQKGANAESLNKQETKDFKSHSNVEINRDVETLSHNELLEIGNKIMINGTTLRQIYDSHLIGERGLRRLVHEHLIGGDIAKALKMEISERELDFERDPLLRDMVPHQYSGGGGSPAAGGQAALEHLLKKADAALEDTSEEAAYYKARAAYEAKQHETKQKNRQVLDISLAAVITSLIAVITYLILIRA